MPGGNTFSGVLADGSYSLAGYHHKPIDDYTAAEALKSYHLLDNTGTAIGSSVKRKSSSSGTDEIVTTIDQSEHSGVLTYFVNGQTTTINAGENVNVSEALTSPSWIHHREKGYLIFPKENQNLLIKTGSSINVTEPGQGSSINYILALDHGANPGSSTKNGYHYVMVANVEASDMPAVLTAYKNDYEVLIEPDAYHALVNAPDKVRQASFYQAGTVNFDADSFIESNRPALIMTRELADYLRLTVVDPLHDLTGSSITIGVSDLLAEGEYRYSFGGISPRLGETATVSSDGVSGSTISIALPDESDGPFYDYQEQMFAGAPILLTLRKVGVASVDTDGDGLLTIVMPVVKPQGCPQIQMTMETGSMIRQICVRIHH